MKKLLILLLISASIVAGCSNTTSLLSDEKIVKETEKVKLKEPEQQKQDESDIIPLTKEQLDEELKNKESNLPQTEIKITPDNLQHELTENEGELINKKNDLPDGFVYLDEVVPYATYDIRYFSTNNFVGDRITGYEAPLAIATEETANALIKVSEELYEQGYTLLIYDTYRPAKAVAFFKLWSTNDDKAMKEQYYPNEEKSQLFKRGYLASKSGHSRGSTVDLTLLYLDSNELVDMGSEYDVLDEISSFNTKGITEAQANNRNILKQVMKKHGFKEYSKEWWHYVLKNEPYPTTYFDFNVK